MDESYGNTAICTYVRGMIPCSGFFSITPYYFSHGKITYYVERPRKHTLLDTLCNVRETQKRGALLLRPSQDRNWDFNFRVEGLPSHRLCTSFREHEIGDSALSKLKSRLCSGFRMYDAMSSGYT